jgi:hypothetical protein
MGKVGRSGCRVVVSSSFPVCKGRADGRVKVRANRKWMCGNG